MRYFIVQHYKYRCLMSKTSKIFHEEIPWVEYTISKFCVLDRIKLYEYQVLWSPEILVRHTSWSALYLIKAIQSKSNIEKIMNS